MTSTRRSEMPRATPSPTESVSARIASIGTRLVTAKPRNRVRWLTLLRLVLFGALLGSVEAAQHGGLSRVRTQADPETGVKFSLERKSSLGREIDPCDSFTGVRATVIGDVPDSVDLADDSIAVSLLNKGKTYAFGQCKLDDNSWADITVLLYRASESEPAVSGSYSWAAKPTFKLDYYRNLSRDARRAREEQQRLEDARRREAEDRQQRLSREFIARTIDGFTMGMSLPDALGLLIRNVREKRVVFLEHEFDWGRFLRQATDPFNKKVQEQLTEKKEWTIDRDTSRPIRRWNTAQVPVEVISVRPFRSTSGSLILRFYKSQLFRVEMWPVTKRHVMHEALINRYGPALSNEGPHAEVWEDRRSVLTYQVFANDSYELVYQDKGLIEGMRAEVDREVRETEERRKREDEQRKKLPGSY